MEEEKLTIDEMVLCDRLRRMKFSAMATALEDMLLDPLSPNRTFEEKITDLINSEWNKRTEKRFLKLLSKANLKFTDAAFDDKIKNPERNIDMQLFSRLITCDWIREGRVLIITGKTGTGKSYLACAFAIFAMRKDYSAFYVSANRLQEMADLADREGEFLSFCDKMTKVDLLIIDDFGLMTLDSTKCMRLFTILDAREKRKATLVTSQIPVKDWYETFSDMTYADACLDRLAKGSFRIALEGPSLRPE